MTDHYETLQVGKNATSTEIRSSYKKLALKYHPDRCKDGNGKFKEISVAYSVLSDSNKRAVYDLDSRQSGIGFANSNTNININASDIFNQFFGGKKQQRYTPNNITYQIMVTLEQICLNKKLNIKFKRDVKCSECVGTKTKNRAPPARCVKCHGRGVLQQNFNLGGIISIPNNVQCTRCSGSGSVIDVANICPTCNGDGKDSKDNTVMMDCSKILTHSSLVFKDDGHYNMLSGTYSNLVIHLSTKPHPMFKRVDQLSISTSVNISLPSALIGYSGIITHPSGRRIPFSEPPGILDGDTCIVAGEGLSPNGDLLIIFKITKTIMDAKMIEEVSEIFKKYNL